MKENQNFKENEIVIYKPDYESNQMTLEKAIESLLEIKDYFEFELQHKNSKTKEEIQLANKYNKAIETILQELKNSIPTKKIEYLLEEVYTDEGIGYELDKDEKPGAVRVLRNLLEDK